MAVPSVVPIDDLPDDLDSSGVVPVTDLPSESAGDGATTSRGWQPALADVAQGIQSVVGPSLQQIASAPGMQPFSNATDPVASLFPKSNGHPLSQAWDSMKALFELPARLSQTLGSASGPVSEAVSEHLGKKGMPSPLAALFGMAAGAISDPRNLVSLKLGNPEFGIEPDPLAQTTAGQFAEAGVTPTPAQLTQGRLAQMVDTLGARYPYSAQKFQDFYTQQMADLDNVRAKLMSTVGDNDATRMVQGMMKNRINSYLSEASPEDAATLQDRFGDLNTYMKNEQAGQFSQGMLGAASKMARDVADKMYEKLPISPDAPIPTPQFAAQAKQFLSDELLAPKADRNASWIGRLSEYSASPEIKTKIGQLDFSGAASPEETQKLIQSISEASRPTPQTPFAGTQMTMKSLRDLRIQNDPGYLIGASGQGNRFAGYAAKLRQALSSDIQNGAEAISPEAGSALANANANYADFKNTFNDPYIRGLLNSDPEDFMNHAIRPDDVTNVGKLKQVLGPEAFLPVKQNFLANMLVNKEGEISPSGFINKVNKFGLPTLSTIFEPDELSEIMNAQNLFGKMGAAEKATGNPSGTAGVLMAKQAILGGPSDVLLTLLFGHAGALAAVSKDVLKNFVLPRMLAKAYLSESVRDLMVNGMVAPDSAMAALGVMGKASMAGANQTMSAMPAQTQSQGPTQ